MEDTRAIRVLVAEGESLLRTAISRLLVPFRDISVTRHAAGVAELLSQLHLGDTDVVVIGSRLEDARPPDAVAAARRAGHRTPILMLGASSQGPHTVAAAVRAGVSGYLPTSCEPEELARAVRTLHAGHPLFQARSDWHACMFTDGRPVMVTPREREVLAHVERGLSNRQIGMALGIAMRTVDKHVENLMRKFQVRDRRRLVAEYREAAS